MRYTLPLGEIVFDFFDQLKSPHPAATPRLDYEPDRRAGGRPGQGRHPAAGRAGRRVQRDRAQGQGLRLRRDDGRQAASELIPRQQFEVPIQAAIGARVIARETIRAIRKDVLAKCYGGDITRKRKLLEKQKEGKKRMKMVGRVEVPQEAFIAALSTDAAGGEGQEVVEVRPVAGDDELVGRRLAVAGLPQRHGAPAHGQLPVVGRALQPRAARRASRQRRPRRLRRLAPAPAAGRGRTGGPRPGRRHRRRAPVDRGASGWCPAPGARRWGRQLALDVIGRYPRPWTIAFQHDNVGAGRFWRGRGARRVRRRLDRGASGRCRTGPSSRRTTGSESP